MEKHIIKVDGDMIFNMTMALAYGKKQAGIEPTDDTAQIIGNELHINGDVETVYAIGLMMGTAIGQMSK